jgi:hypothetical protein
MLCFSLKMAPRVSIWGLVVFRNSTFRVTKTWRVPLPVPVRRSGTFCCGASLCLIHQTHLLPVHIKRIHYDRNRPGPITEVLPVHKTYRYKSRFPGPRVALASQMGPHFAALSQMYRSNDTAFRTCTVIEYCQRHSHEHAIKRTTFSKKSYQETNHGSDTVSRSGHHYYSPTINHNIAGRAAAK